MNLRQYIKDRYIEEALNLKHEYRDIVHCHERFESLFINNKRLWNTNDIYLLIVFLTGYVVGIKGK